MGGALPGAIYVCPGFILSNQAWSLNGNLGAPVCGSGISRLSICGGSGLCGVGTGAVAKSDNRVLGGSMGEGPPYPTGRLTRFVSLPRSKLGIPNLIFLNEEPSRGAKAGHIPALSGDVPPKSLVSPFNCTPTAARGGGMVARPFWLCK